MSYRKLLVGGISALLIIGTPLLVLAGDTTYKTRKIVSVPSGETISGDFFAAGEEIEISGTVQGDLYTAGANVVINGTVEGDVLAAGGSVRITGAVDHDVRVAGGQVDITGTIGGNVTAVGGDIAFSEAGSVNGNIVTAGGNIVLASDTGGDITSAGGNVSIAGNVGGKVTSHSDALRLSSNAHIGKTLTYWSPQEASIDSNAKVSGGTTFNQSARKTMPDKKVLETIAGIKIIKHLVAFGAFLIVGLLIVRFFPIFAEHTRTALMARPWESLGTGVLVYLATPFICVILMLTIVGLPLGIMGLLIYVPLLYLGKFTSILAIGRLIFKNRSASWAIVAGTVVFYALRLIPFLGGLITLIISLAGLGAWLSVKKTLYRELRTQGKI